MEDLLLSHSLISDAAVIRIPDGRVSRFDLFLRPNTLKKVVQMGELLRAYVVRANDKLTENGVVYFVARTLRSV